MADCIMTDAKEVCTKWTAHGSWQGSYWKAQIWRECDPQNVLQCTHRHRTSNAALHCANKLAALLEPEEW